MAAFVGIFSMSSQIRAYSKRFALSRSPIKVTYRFTPDHLPGIQAHSLCLASKSAAEGWLKATYIKS